MKDELRFIEESDGGGTFIPVGGIRAKILEMFHQFRF